MLIESGSQDIQLVSGGLKRHELKFHVKPQKKKEKKVTFVKELFHKRLKLVDFPALGVNLYFLAFLLIKKQSFSI